MVAAADARVGIALANRFPALKLSGSVGYSATSLTELLDELIYSVTGGLVQPLFMGGALAAEQDRAESLVEERLHTFGQVRNSTDDDWIDIELNLVANELTILAGAC